MNVTTLDLAGFLTPEQLERLKSPQVVKTIKETLISALSNDIPETLEEQNKRLIYNNKVNGVISDVALDALFESWRWKNKMVGLAKRIKKLDDEKGKDSIYKIRMALWLVSKRIGLSKEEKKEFKKFNIIDINKGYKIISKKLNSKIKDSNNMEMISIRTIMKYINKYHEEYANQNNVTESDRIYNMKMIDSNIANAA